MEVSAKQIVVLDFIKQFIASKGYSPTVREICFGLGYRSPGTVQEHIKKLVNAGLITINPTKSRTIELLVENEYLLENESIIKLPIITEEYLDTFSKEFLDVPKFMANGYDSKYLVAFKENEKNIYIINKALKPMEDSLVLVYNEKLYISNKKSTDTLKVIGTIISKYEIY